MSRKRVLELCRIYLAQAWSDGWNRCITAEGKQEGLGHEQDDVDHLLKRLTAQIKPTRKSEV
jgi:hypothetical protein